MADGDMVALLALSFNNGNLRWMGRLNGIIENLMAVMIMATPAIHTRN